MRKPPKAVMWLVDVVSDSIYLDLQVVLEVWSSAAKAESGL